MPLAGYFLQEISDDLTNYLGELIRQIPTDLENLCNGRVTEAIKYGYVTYTAPSFCLNAPTITLSEGRSLLASGGDTGLRTWEAALLLGTYLYTEGRELVHRKAVLELGAGTGFLSILCAKHLGSSHVMATDGSQQCVKDIVANIALNGLEGDLQGISSAVLQWGHLDEEILHSQDVNYRYDLILGADVVRDDPLQTLPSFLSSYIWPFFSTSNFCLSPLKYPGIEAWQGCLSLFLMIIVWTDVWWRGNTILGFNFAIRLWTVCKHQNSHRCNNTEWTYIEHFFQRLRLVKYFS